MVDLIIKQIILNSVYSALVFSNGSEFVLIPLKTDVENPETTVTELTKAGHEYAGLFAYADGKFRAKCDNVAMLPTMRTAMFAFADYVKEQLTPRKDDDSVDWLRKLDTLDLRD
jgi:hypothetical protein